MQNWHFGKAIDKYLMSFMPYSLPNYQCQSIMLQAKPFALSYTPYFVNVF
jgi:hypothetical protein